jgi:hypothetical protein
LHCFAQLEGSLEAEEEAAGGIVDGQHYRHFAATGPRPSNPSSSDSHVERVDDVEASFCRVVFNVLCFCNRPFFFVCWSIFVLTSNLLM